MLSQEISLQRSPKFSIGRRHFEGNAQRLGRARPLSVASCRARDLLLASEFVLEVMADIQPYRFEPERFSNPEDSESENEEVNDRLEAHFCVVVSHVKSCQRKENVFVAENSQRKKTKMKVEF